LLAAFEIIMRNFNRLYFSILICVSLLSFAGINAVSAQTQKTKIVRFAPGKSSAVLKGSVVRGTENRYIVSARAGQTMRVKVTSTENNAVFTVYFAGGQESLVNSEESTDWTQRLEAGNDYEIIVAPVRGNATYTLTIGVK
jgi:hypothetical protein